jgi:hypothetical protein
MNTVLKNVFFIMTTTMDEGLFLGQPIIISLSTGRINTNVFGQNGQKLNQNDTIMNAIRMAVVCDGIVFREKNPVIGGEALIEHSRGYIRGTYMGHDKTHYILNDCTVYSDVGRGLEKMETCRRAWGQIRCGIRVP